MAVSKITKLDQAFLQLLAIQTALHISGSEGIPMCPERCKELAEKMAAASEFALGAVKSAARILNGEASQ